jgi:hypothetical protein
MQVVSPPVSRVSATSDQEEPVVKTQFSMLCPVVGLALLVAA